MANSGPLDPDGQAPKKKKLKLRDRFANLSDRAKKDFDSEFSNSFQNTLDGKGPPAVKNEFNREKLKDTRPKFEPILHADFTPFKIDSELKLTGMGSADLQVGFAVAAPIRFETVLAAGVIGIVPVDLRAFFEVKLSGKVVVIKTYKPTADRNSLAASDVSALGKFGVAAEGGLQANAALGLLASAEVKVGVKGELEFSKSFNPLEPLKTKIVLEAAGEISGNAIGGLLEGKAAEVKFFVFEQEILLGQPQTPKIKFFESGTAALNRIFGSPSTPTSASSAITTAGASVLTNGPPTGIDDPDTTVIDLGGTQGTVERSDVLNRREEGILYGFNLVDVAGSGHSATITFEPNIANLNLTLLDQRLAVIDHVGGSKGSLSINLAKFPAGRYFLGVRGEFDDAQPLMFDLTVSAPSTTQADLVASVVIDTDLVFPGQNLPVTWTVRNVGSAPAPATEARLVWSRDLVIDGNDANLIATKLLEVPALAPDEHHTQTTVVKLPAGELGTIVIGAVADHLEVVSESSEDDNSGLATVFFILVPDENEPDDEVLLATSLGGLHRQIRVDDQTLHDASDVDLFRFYLSEEGREEDQIDLVLPEESVGVGIELRDDDFVLVGEGIGFADAPPEDTIIPLEGLAAGNYYIRVVGLEGRPTTYDLRIDSASRSGRNLVVEQLERPIAMRPTLPTQIAINVANFGSVAAHNVDLAVFVETESGDVNVGSTTLGALQSNQEERVPLEITLPSGLPAHEVLTLRAEIDPAEEISELNEQDNALSGIIQLTAEPDANEAVERQQGLVDLGVVQGNLTDAGNLDYNNDIDRFQLTLAGPGAAGDAIDVAFSHAAGDIDLILFDPAGETVRETKSDTDNESISLEGLSEGTYIFWVMTNDAEFEDNSYSLSITVGAINGINLVPTSLELSQLRFSPGDDVDVTTEIGNFGSQASGSFAIQYVLTNDDILDLGTDMLIGDPISLDSIDGGASTVDNRTLTIPASVGAGSGFLAIVVDPADGVIETGELDNQIAQFIGVLPAPDVNETNDTVGDATELPLTDGLFVQDGLTIGLADVDVFALSVSGISGLTDTVQVEFDDDEGDLEVLLLDKLRNEIRRGGVDDGSTFLTLGGVEPGDYSVQVHPVVPGG